MRIEHHRLWTLATVASLAAVIALAGCEAGTTIGTLVVSSTAFVDNGEIPSQYTADGTDISPPLSWTGAPVTTQSFVLIMDDPDATAGTWVHWVLFNIPATTTTLPEDVDDGETPADVTGARQGTNSWGDIAYGGPAPPIGSGTHHYTFKVYALDTQMTLAAGATRDDVVNAMAGHILAQGELVGTYERP